VPRFLGRKKHYSGTQFRPVFPRKWRICSLLRSHCYSIIGYFLFNLRQKRLTRTFLLRRRDSTRVIFDILSSASKGASKTKIVYSANLNFRFSERYLSFLVSKQLIEKRDDLDFKVYKTTQRGGRLLALLAEVEKELAEAPSTKSYPARTLVSSVLDQDLSSGPFFGTEPVRTLIEDRKRS